MKPNILQKERLINQAIETSFSIAKKIWADMAVVLFDKVDPNYFNQTLQILLSALIQYNQQATRKCIKKVLLSVTSKLKLITNQRKIQDIEMFVDESALLNKSFVQSQAKIVLKNTENQQQKPSLQVIHTKPKSNTQLNEFYTDIMDKIPIFKPKTFVKLDKSKRQQSSGQENLNINNRYQIEQINLQKFKTNELNPKIQQLMASIFKPSNISYDAINGLFQQNSQNAIQNLAANAKFIFASTLKSAYRIINERAKHTPDKIVTHLDLLQNCIKCPHITRNIGELLNYGLNFGLTQLIYQDTHKKQIEQELLSRNIEYKKDSFIKAVNGVTLRLLQKANPQQIVNTLLSLLRRYSSQNSSPKIIHLTVKCLDRVSGGFCKNLQSQDVKAFLLNSHRYLASINYDRPMQYLPQKQEKQKASIEDTAANLIKTIIADIFKSIKLQIWKIYQQTFMQFQYPDKYLASYIKSLINPKKQLEKKKENQSQKIIQDQINKLRQKIMEHGQLSQKNQSKEKQQKAQIKQRILEMKKKLQFSRSKRSGSK